MLAFAIEDEETGGFSPFIICLHGMARALVRICSYPICPLCHALDARQLAGKPSKHGRLVRDSNIRIIMSCPIGAHVHATMLAGWQSCARGHAGTWAERACQPISCCAMRARQVLGRACVRARVCTCGRAYAAAVLLPGRGLLVWACVCASYELALWE